MTNNEIKTTEAELLNNTSTRYPRATGNISLAKW